jgi:protein-disulfide isomerase-like protein with CxxC motif
MKNLDIIHAAQALAAMPAAAIPSKEQTRLHYAFSLARYVEGRRRELNMLIQRAAELAGIEFSEWCGLEQGWVPSAENTISAIAETLEVSRVQIVVLAMVARANQRPC